MSLSGVPFLVLMLVLTGLGFGAAVWLMPRLSSSTVKAVAGRAGVLVVVNALVVLSGAVAMNDQYQFFADWTDLRGALFGGTSGTTTLVGSAPAQAASGPITPGPGRSPQPFLPVLPQGAKSSDRVLRFTLHGAQSGLTGAVLVTLPEGYSLPQNAHRQYPVLETFPGYPGEPSQWTESMNLGGAIDAAVKKHLMGPTIIVSPTIEFPPGVDTECTDTFGNGPNVETWVTQDVPEWVLQTLRVRADRTSWATIGLSSGGWCAAMATMLHPTLYSAGIIMGGYFAPKFSHGYVPFRPSSPWGKHYDLVALTKRAPPSVALWLETSHSDSISYGSTSKLLKATRPPLSVQALVLTHAGHRLGLWRSEVPQALAWLGAHISGFSATASR